MPHAPSGHWPTLRRVVAITHAGSHVLDCGHMRDAPTAGDGRGFPLLTCKTCITITDLALYKLHVKRGTGLSR